MNLSKVMITSEATCLTAELPSCHVRKEIHSKSYLAFSKCVLSFYYGPGARSMDEEGKQIWMSIDNELLLYLEIIRVLQRGLLQKNSWSAAFLVSNFQILKISLENSFKEVVMQWIYIIMESERSRLDPGPAS